MSRDLGILAVCSEDVIEMFDHDPPASSLTGHDQCFPKCKPVHRTVTARRWETLSGEPITDPDLIERLEARKEGKRWL